MNKNPLENIVTAKNELKKFDETIIENNDEQIDDFESLEDLISIENEIEKNVYEYTTLNPRSETNPEFDLGIEITIPKLMLENVENIDPQHGKNANIESSAIEKALNYNLDKLPQGSKIATLRPDADSIGAMAVLELRSQDIIPDKELIKMIGKFDSYGYKKAQEMYPEIEVRQEEITAASQVCLGRDKSIEEKVTWMKKLLTNKANYDEIQSINNKWLEDKEKAKKSLEISPIVDDKAVLVTGSHPQAFAVGYEQAGIVAAYNPNFVRPWIENDTACEKWTIARYSEAEKIDIAKLKELLNEYEKKYSAENYDHKKTWGGPANLVASPQGYTSNIPKEKIIETIKSCIK